MEKESKVSKFAQFADGFKGASSDFRQLRQSSLDELDCLLEVGTAASSRMC